MSGALLVRIGSQKMPCWGSPEGSSDYRKLELSCGLPLTDFQGYRVVGVLFLCHNKSSWTASHSFDIKAHFFELV